MKKLPALLNTPARAVIAVGLIILLGEFLIMLLIEGIHNTILKDAVLEKIVFEFIDPILLIAIVSPTFYLLIFRPMRTQQANIEQQLDELRRFQRLSIGRELRMKELVEEIAALRHPLSVEPAGDLPVTSGSPEKSRDATAQTATTQTIEQSQRSALLFMLEDLEAARKKIEQAHQEWIAALDVVNDPIFLHDKQFRVLRCNKAYQQHAGLPFKQIIGQLYYEVFPKIGAPLPSCLRVMEKAEAAADEEEMVVGDATYRSRAFSMHDDQGAYFYSVHTLEDITKRKKAEEALKESEKALLKSNERFDLAVKGANDGIWDWDIETNANYFSPRFLELLDYGPGELVHELATFDFLLHPEDRAWVFDRVRQHLEDKVPYNVEYRMRTKNGEYRWFQARGEAIRDQSGKPFRMAGSITDITKRKHQEERTAALLELSTSVETLDEKTLLQRGLDTAQHLTDSRIGFLHFVSEDQNEIELATWSTDTLAHYCQATFDRHYPVSDAGIWADCIRLKQAIIVNDYTAAANKKGLPEGHAHLQRLISVPVFDGTQVRMIVGVGNAARNYGDHDVETVKLFSYDLYRIVQRKRAEAQLKNSEERHRQIIQTSMDGFWITDTKGRILDVNDAYCQLVGYAREELLNMRIPDVEAKETPEDTAQHIREIMTKGYARFETCHRRKDGQLLDIEVSVVHRPDTEGGHFFIFLRDITDRKRTENSLHHLNRALKTLGTVNHALVYATDEEVLLHTVCHAIAEDGYQLAWVGYVQHDANKTIKVMTHAGHEAGYLETLGITWADTESSQAPCGQAVRSGIPVVCQNILSDPDFCTAWRNEALKRGYASLIALPLASEEGVFGVLCVHAAETDAFTVGEISLLEEMAADLAFGVAMLRLRLERDRAMKQSQNYLGGLRDSLEETVRAIALTVEMRDPYTAGHQRRVADLATAIATHLGLPAERVHGIHLAGVVHDLGKINIPSEILSKPGKISEMEFGFIKTHAQAGYNILKDINFPWPIAQMVLQHHERLDGSGYPQGLKGEAILLEARILAVADVVEAMSSHRPYRPGLGIEVALAEITKQRGSHFDPAVVDACSALFREQHYAFKG